MGAKLLLSVCGCVFGFRGMVLALKANKTGSKEEALLGLKYSTAGLVLCGLAQFAF